MLQWILTLVLSLEHVVMPSLHNRPLKALVYRGPASSYRCPESVADLLESSPFKIEVTFAGPDEETKLTAEALSNVDIYAHPGGGGNIGHVTFRTERC